ncbi:hypothetical protein ZWY2020_021822 [Hordeum vulgare]|nr:hypothetical protein ZWY2020_021822 [Hordeum vulgare]
MARLQVAGSSMVKDLWPDSMEPVLMSRLSRWLAAGVDASATRAGAYMALRLAKSWYQNLDLGKLVAQCDGSEGELQAVEEELRVWASDIASFDEAAREVEDAASSGEAYADSAEDEAESPHGGDGATASGAAGDGEATTPGAAAGATNEAAAP